MTFSPITNVLTERKNPKPKPDTNEFDLIKAAAWAWYERGSGSEGKSIPEFDFTTYSHRILRPSRYKIEAMKNKASEDLRSTTSISNNISPGPSFSSSLLDTYEIESISRDLDSYVESSNYDGGGCGLRRSVVVLREIETGEMVGKVKNKKVKKGFWLRQGVVCGSKEDVVVPGINIVGRRQPEKRVTAV